MPLRASEGLPRRNVGERRGKMTKRSKILIVDDDKILIGMYKERLELSGYQIETASNGEKGLARVHQEEPDIILLDIMMPKADGYTVLSSIKSDPRLKDIPVIVISALGGDEAKTKAAEIGADDYLIKSETMPGEVIKKIEKVLEKKNI